MVVEHLVRHTAPKHFPLLAGACAREDASAVELGDLDSGAAEPARARPHEHRVGGADACLSHEHLPGGDVRVRECGDMLVRHRRVDTHRELRGHEEELRVRAVVDVEVGAQLELASHAVAADTALHVRVRRDPVAWPKALDARADLHDVAADVDAQYGREVDVVRGVRMAPADPDVAVVDGRRAQPDEQVARAGLGLGDLVELERLRPAVGVDANGTHELEGLAPFPGRPPRVKIAIVGGGIGGVTAALALVRKGIQVEVLEQAATIEPVGASLQLGPNAMRLLADLGLLPALRTVGVRPDAVDFVRWDDGSLLLHTELGEAAERHFGAPQLDFFRPDLHRVLVDALPPGVLRLGVRIERVEQDDAGVMLVASGGDEIRADAAVAADGINSRLRQQLWGADDPVFSNTVVYRGVVPREAVEHLHPDGLNVYWLGPNRHGVSYWIGGGRLLAMNCAVRDAEWSQESWTLETEPAEAAEAFAGWDPHLVERIRLVTTTLRGAVFVRTGLEHWSFGRMTLLGDAAHAM